jgi:hypothetical protein
LYVPLVLTLSCRLVQMTLYRMSRDRMSEFLVQNVKVTKFWMYPPRQMSRQVTGVIACPLKEVRYQRNLQYQDTHTPAHTIATDIKSVFLSRVLKPGPHLPRVPQLDSTGHHDPQRQTVPSVCTWSRMSCPSACLKTQLAR